jgi:hypothetical protein
MKNPGTQNQPQPANTQIFKRSKCGNKLTFVPVRCLVSPSVYLTLIDCEGNSMFCGPETVNVSGGETEGNIGSRRFTKQTVSRGHSQYVFYYIK